MEKINSSNWAVSQFLSNFDIFYDDAADIKNVFAHPGSDAAFCECRTDMEIDGELLRGGDFVIIERKTGQVCAVLKAIKKPLKV